MTTQHVQPPVQDITPRNPVGTPWYRRRAVALTAGVVGLLAAGAATVFVVVGRGPDTPAGSPTAEIGIPKAVGGLVQAPPQQDFSSSKSWMTTAQQAAGGATVVARQYGTPKERKYIRVVAARTDLTGKLELAWAGDAGKEYGDARCTQSIAVSPKVKPSVKPTIFLCWRTSATFSAYAMVIDFDGHPKAKDGVAVIDQIWDEALAQAK